MKRIAIYANSHRARAAVQREVGPLVEFSFIRFTGRSGYYHCWLIPAHMAERALSVRGAHRVRVSEIELKSIRPCHSAQVLRCGTVGRVIVWRAREVSV